MRNIQASFKIQWNHQKIEEFASKLDRLRSVLALTAILALHASTNSNNEETLAHLKELHMASKTHGSESAEIIASIQLLADMVQGQAETKLDTINARI